MKRWLLRFLDALLGGSIVLAGIQLPGVVLDLLTRFDIAPPEIWFILVLLFAVLVLAARRLVAGTLRPRLQSIDSAVFAFVIAAGLAQLAPVLTSTATMPVDNGSLLVPRPGGPHRDCRGTPRRCVEYTTNELGFRGLLVQRPRPDAHMVAFIGDSFIFGSGVNDNETVPSVVSRLLANDIPPVVALNAGIPGLAAGSFPPLIQYVRREMTPDAIVVLFKDDDLDETDILSRWNRFRRNFWYRLLYVGNLETIYETARQISRQWLIHSDRGALLVSRLNEIAAASSGTHLIILAKFSQDMVPVFSRWMAAHPAVGSVNSWEQPLLGRGDSIPGDGHWTKAGCAGVASLAAAAVHEQFSRTPPRSSSP